MKPDLKKIGLSGIALLTFVLLLAWYDGGRQEQRLIVQDVDVTAVMQGQNG